MSLPGPLMSLPGPLMSLPGLTGQSMPHADVISANSDSKSRLMGLTFNVLAQ